MDNIRHIRDPWLVKDSLAVESYKAAVWHTPLWKHIIKVVMRHLHEVGISYTVYESIFRVSYNGVEEDVIVTGDTPLLYLTLQELVWLVDDTRAMVNLVPLTEYCPWLLTSEEYDGILSCTKVRGYLDYLNKLKRD